MSHSYVKPETVEAALKRLRHEQFTTLELADRLKKVSHAEWYELERRYGSGGRGNGSHYSPYTYIAQVILQKNSSRYGVEDLRQHGKPADAGARWGSPTVQHWRVRSPASVNIEPSDKTSDAGLPVLFSERSEITTLRTTHERSRSARRACVEAHGDSCAACGFNFGRTYGELGEGFIHVHHITPMSKISGEYQLDPVRDLVPVCPNCLEMLHRGTNTLTVLELKSLLVKN